MSQIALLPIKKDVVVVWNTETIFTSEDLADGFPWCVFMEAEYTIYDETSAKEGIQKRREHIQYCIEQMQEELSKIDELALRLPGVAHY